MLLYNLYHAKVESLNSINDYEEVKFLYLKNALDIVVKTGQTKWILYEYKNYITELLKAGKINEMLKVYKKFQKILKDYKFEILQEMIKNDVPINNIIKVTGYNKEEIIEIKKIMILVKKTLQTSN